MKRPLKAGPKCRPLPDYGVVSPTLGVPGMSTFHAKQKRTSA